MDSGQPNNQRPFATSDVAAAFDAFPDNAKTRLLEIRALIFAVADDMPQVGNLTECLKWGQPSYLTTETKSGTTIRLGIDKTSNRPALYVHCQTNLLDQFRSLFPESFGFSGNRALLIKGAGLPNAELRHCIGLALTYHLRRR